MRGYGYQPGLRTREEEFGREGGGTCLPGHLGTLGKEVQDALGFFSQGV